MASKRLELQALLEEMLGSEQVYFQPPPNFRMDYPAIVYHRDLIGSIHADNLPFCSGERYAVTYIDEDPDSELPMKLAALPTAAFSTQYTADNLNHTVFTLYF